MVSRAILEVQRERKKKTNGCRRPAGAEVRDGELLKTSRPVAGCRAIDGKEEKKCIVIAGIRTPDRPALSLVTAYQDDRIIYQHFILNFV